MSVALRDFTRCEDSRDHLVLVVPHEEQHYYESQQWNTNNVSPVPPR